MRHLGSTKPIAVTAPQVVVQQPTLAQITEYVTQTGTMVAYNSVNLVARIEGYLDAVKFTDGSFVKKGQELFVIEPEPYYEQLIEAQSSVAAQKAQYQYSTSEYARQKRMFRQNATSENNVEKWAAQMTKDKAEIDKVLANEVVAKINYSYTHVLAPFDGRIGRHLVDPGNLVGNGKATDLATIEQISPIYVYFNLNELDLLKIREAIRNNVFNPQKIDEVTVYVKMQNEDEFKHKGLLNFVNTGLNASTGTLEFRAIFKNPEYILLPGLFVQVRIPISNPTPQLTVPEEAIQFDQIGAYLLVLGAHNKVEIRRIQTGATEQGMRAITKGINAQDKIIVAGILNATPGNPVTPVQSASNKS
ncbi:MAG: efflux RND transporter periplasmic adaptor subunit [Tatlockia sp.]